VTSVAPIDLERDGEVTIVVVRGEHDLSTAETLRSQLDAVRAERRPFVVDLSQATFIDSAVLGVLIAAHDRASSDGTAVAFAVGSGPTVRKIIDLTGLEGVLPITDSRADAILRAIGVDG
jgi:anti-sigma B factor antagonist